MRETIGVRGAKENNLKNIDIEIPRNQFVVVTGVSGSGKSSLAFETIYAEGQRRFLESLSAYSKRFVVQLKKPKVDFVTGLSPVISIEQKSVNNNPRSTVGTMTDIYDYVRILFATIGDARCPFCSERVPVMSAPQMTEHLLSLPTKTSIEICAPVLKLYGEDYPFLFGEIRNKGYRRMRIDDELVDLSDDLELDETREYRLEAVIDKFHLSKDLFKQIETSIQHGLRVGDGFLRFRILSDLPGENKRKFFANFACPNHQVTMGELLAYYFSFNEPDSACNTCLGLGVYLNVHPDLLVPDKNRSVIGGCFVHEAFHYDKNSWGTRLIHSLAVHYGIDLNMPFKDLSPAAVDLLFYGSKGERFPLLIPEGATKGDEHLGKPFRFNGIINDIERRYRHYRQQKVAHSWMEEYLKKVMVERVCPDCKGTRLKKQRLCVTLQDRNVHELSNFALSDLRDFLRDMPPSERQWGAGEQVRDEIVSRLELLMGIGMDYLSLGRKAGTLSGGESQRIRLSTQIGSGLMGMLYVLDEPSIGLHPRDNRKMIDTLRRLRDIGNSVIVVEHDEETIREADYLVEIGPGPGVHGGEVVAQGTPEELIQNPNSLTGQFLSGARGIPIPAKRRVSNGKFLTIVGAKENNLQNLTVQFPLGQFVCVTGVSGSGKSTLINQILQKKLYSLFHDSRTLAGEHERLEGHEHINDVISIDQTPIGRTPTSNPATYVGVYDTIRQLFAKTPESIARGYTAGRFSFNVKGGRCEECSGQGIVTISLHFMPDVESPCPICKGARYNADTLEVTYRNKTITDVLDMSIEEASSFFGDVNLIAHKLNVLNQLGMGYLKLGQSSTTISGGEAQRVKLAQELSKIKRSGKNLYILDEPTTGLHLADIQKLLDSLNKLVDAGHTVIVIEHHLDVIKTADYVIDMGPDGGRGGGHLVVCGSPEEVAKAANSYTGAYLKKVLKTQMNEA